jgi:thiol peroxidase
MDLPFAQKCWCGSAGIDQIITLSDHFEASFGTAYGSTYKRTSFIDQGHIYSGSTEYDKVSPDG